MDLEARLEQLKADNVIAGWVGPHKNYGLGAPTLPWTIMPVHGGPASNYYNDVSLLTAIQALEHFGPTFLRQPTF